jgi:hypothetical protein
VRGPASLVHSDCLQMDEIKVVQPGIGGRYQEELARHQKGKTVGRKKRLDTFYQLIHISGNYNRRMGGGKRRNVTILLWLSMLNTFGNHMSKLFFSFKIIRYFSSKLYFRSLHNRHKTKITPTYNHLVSKFENGDQFYKCKHMWFLIFF